MVFRAMISIMRSGAAPVLYASTPAIKIFRYIITVTISYHAPLQNKVRCLYFIFCIFYVAGGLSQKEPLSNLRTCNYNTDKIIVSITPLSGPSAGNAILPFLESQTPASRIYGTSHMSIAEPVSRKSTRKIGAGRFIKQSNSIKSAREKVTII